MNLRQYTATVQRTQEQTVTFVVDLDALPDGELLPVAVAHCKDDQWSEAQYQRSNITSERLLPS